ncbi:MAG: hypothetical protein DRQ88_05475 [Epsilonproteobacteria bacterium]|nr:MAG: hypothetical protein DRQ89_08490 [Campylobacterota bacterium]RLA66766.1 MAG: hypothetical protein DRQ88_05475 [Campylobacterota bacterium]
MKIFILLLLIPFSTWAKIFKCELNIASPGQTVKANQIQNFVKEVNFDTTSKQGKVISLGGINIYLWNKNFYVNLKYEEKVRNLSFTSQYFPARDSFSLEVKPHYQFKCSSRGAAKRVVSESKIDPQQSLDKYQRNLWIKTSSNLKFVYYQKNVVDRMRPIIFQNGMLYTADSSRDIQGNWCIFNVQVKLDEDTYINSGSKLQVMSFNKLSNNPTHNVYAYNFVDIVQGKKRSETSRYAPFSLECKIKKSQVFTLDLFKKITGNRLSLYIAKD